MQDKEKVDTSAKINAYIVAKRKEAGTGKPTLPMKREGAVSSKIKAPKR
jgi:hypothetical protein